MYMRFVFGCTALLSLSAFANSEHADPSYENKAEESPVVRTLPKFSREESDALLSKLAGSNNKRLMSLLWDLDSKLPTSNVEVLARPNPASPSGYDIVIMLGEAHIKSCDTAKAVKEVLSQTNFVGLESADKFGGKMVPPLLFDKKAKIVMDSKGHTVPFPEWAESNERPGGNWSDILKRTNLCPSSIIDAIHSQPRFFILENLSKMNLIQKANVAAVTWLVNQMSKGATGDAVAQHLSDVNEMDMQVRLSVMKEEARLAQEYANTGKVKTSSIIGDDRSRMMATSINSIANSKNYHAKANEPIVTVTGADHVPFMKYDLASRYGFKVIDKQALQDLAAQK